MDPVGVPPRCSLCGELLPYDQEVELRLAESDKMIAARTEQLSQAFDKIDYLHGLLERLLPHLRVLGHGMLAGGPPDELREAVQVVKAWQEEKSRQPFEAIGRAMAENLKSAITNNH